MTASRSNKSASKILCRILNPVLLADAHLPPPSSSLPLPRVFVFVDSSGVPSVFLSSLLFLFFFFYRCSAAWNTSGMEICRRQQKKGAGRGRGNRSFLLAFCFQHLTRNIAWENGLLVLELLFISLSFSLSLPCFFPMLESSAGPVLIRDVHENCHLPHAGNFVKHDYRRFSHARSRSTERERDRCTFRGEAPAEEGSV